MRRAPGGPRSAPAKGRFWILPRRDLADGAGLLLRLSHPLLPDFSSARPVDQGLLLGPAVPPPAPLTAGLDADRRRAYLVRLVSLTAFLKLHGLGVAAEDVARIGARTDDPARPRLAVPPVPDWRAVPPALVAAAVAARFGGASPAGDDADSLRTSVQRGLESGVRPDATRDVVTALRAEESGRRPEALLREIGRGRDLGPIGPDLLGLVYPSVFTSEAENGSIRSAWGPAALWVIRGAARRIPDLFFVECAPGPPLEEGSGLLRLARLLDGDPRAGSLRVLAEGKSGRRLPDGPPAALVALEAGRWDPRSRRLFETAVGGGNFARFETRSGPAPAWEIRSPLAPRLATAEISSLLYLPYATLGESVVAWESAARSATGDPARFLAAVQRLAAGFDPAGRRDGPKAAARVRRVRDPVLEAASLLADGFSSEEAAAASGIGVEEGRSALLRAVEKGLLVEEGGSFRFHDEDERRRLVAKGTPRARRDALARLRDAGTEGDRLVIASLSRGDPDDVEAARSRLSAAAGCGDRAAALQLLRRAPESAPDLGAPALALGVFFGAGRLDDARRIAGRLTAASCRDLPDDERLVLARRLAKLRETARALALYESPRTAAEFIARAQLLVKARREEEATRLLASVQTAEGLSSGERTRVTVLEAEIAERRGDYVTASALLREAAGLLPDVTDPGLAFDAMLTAGYLAADMERLDEALSFFRAARAAASDDGQRADAAVDISAVAIEAGRYADAERELEAALDLYARRGDEPSYLSALGNRVDLLLRLGDFGAAERVLERVLSHDRAPGREHQFLFAVPALQQLALIEGDLSRAHEAFQEGETRVSAAPGHPAWRKVLVLEAKRLLVSGQPREALDRLEAARRAPDNRMKSEPLRKRLVLSAGLDLGTAPDPSLLAAMSPAERILLETERRLARGEEPETDSLKELEGRLTTGSGAGEVAGRILEWAARFSRAFTAGAGAGLLALGEKAAARAGLPRAAARLERLSRELRREAARAPAPARPTDPGDDFVAEDASTRAAFSVVEKIARTSLTLLVLGESGTGKEIVAKAVHRLSGRSGLFVPLNVATLSSTLVESELFGHSRGAFTGADRDRPGVIESSSGGTLFLDEIGDLPLAAQAKLLRVLQESEIRRIGETRTRRVDLRVVAATHRDLRAMSAAGTFRHDLYYRLAGHEVALAPLRERPRDLEQLLERALGGATLSKEARRLVLAYSWPGNVRELRAAIESARALAEPARVLEVAHLPAAVRAAAGEDRPRVSRYFDAIRDAKTRAIVAALERHGGNRTRAAKDLGLSRQSLLYEIKKLKIGK